VIGASAELPAGLTFRRDTPARSPLGVTVAVASRDLAVGEVVGSDDLARRAVPADSVLGRAAVDPVGQTVSAPIYEGELVSERRLVDGGRFGLETGEVAVGIIPPLAPVPVDVGDVVALVAVGADPLGGASAQPIGHARVVATDERAVTVALPESMASAVFEAQAVGTVEIALTALGG
jgi:Flp pilus assembly protein CpaB